MITKESFLVSCDGISLHTVDWLPNSEPRAVIGIIHGLGEHIGRYADVAKVLTRAGYLVCGLDLRGHGKSEGRRGDSPTFEYLLNDIDIFLQTIRSKVRDISIFLYGHSMGGNILANFVIKRKPLVSGIVLSCPGFVPTSLKSHKCKFLVAQVLNYIAPTFLVSNTIDPADLSRDRETVSRYQKDPFVHDRISLRLSIDIVNAGKWAVREAAKFDSNLLFLQGGSDHIVDIDSNLEFAHNVSGSTQIRFWPELFHEIHNEPERQEVFLELLKWLESFAGCRKIPNLE